VEGCEPRETSELGMSKEKQKIKWYEDIVARFAFDAVPPNRVKITDWRTFPFLPDDTEMLASSRVIWRLSDSIRSGA
jgi:hypothetical protein